MVAECKSLNWYWPEPGGFSTAVPITGQLVFGAARLLVANTEKLNPGVLVKVNCKAAAAPVPTRCVEPGMMVMGNAGVVVVSELVALNWRLSMAYP